MRYELSAQRIRGDPQKRGDQLNSTQLKKGGRLMKRWLTSLVIAFAILPFALSSVFAYVSIGQKFKNITRADLIDLYDFPVMVTGAPNADWTWSAGANHQYATFPQNMILALRLTGSLDPNNHPPDSMFGFLQRVVNALIKSGSGGQYGTIPYFRNYLDLMIKRFTDGDTATHVDFDTATFRHVNADYNGDGVPNGWEMKPILSGTCMNIPLVGEVCINMYLYDVDGPGNPAGLIVDYDPSTSYFEVKPDEGSDVEDSGIPSSSLGFSSDNPRTDDDSLDVTIVLNDFQLDTFFEPPHADQVTTTAVVKDWYDDAVSDPATDLSNYLKAYGKLIIPTLKISLGLRVLSTYNDEVYPRVVAIGFELTNLSFDTNIQLVLNDGPYCKSSTPHEDGFGVWAYVRADGTVNYHPTTDNEYNCVVTESATIANNGGATDSYIDDSTYKISTRLTEIVPFLEAEIRAYMEDKFTSEQKPAPGYYFGPTSLLDLSSMLGKLHFDWPLRAGTDVVQIELGLSSDVDLDGKGEFWADQWGVLVPFNAGVELLWYYGSLTQPTATTPVAVTSCVWNDAAFTGYVDGWLRGTTSDDPYLTQPLNLRYWYSSASTDPLSGILNGWELPYPVKNWTPPSNIAPPGNYKIVDNFPPFYVTPFTYAIGLAVHQNLLSMLVYDLAVKGLLCINLDGNDPNNPLASLKLGGLGGLGGLLGGGTKGGLLNTETFKMIFPALEKAFPDSVMYIRILPLFKNSPVPADVASSYPNGITSDYWYGYEFAPAIPKDVKVPFAIMGGPVIKTMSFDTLPHGGIAPDFSIVIPHLVVEFYVYDANAGNILRRAFAVDLELVLGLNIDILRPDMVPMPYGAGGNPNVPYAYTGTWYPIGCLGPNDPVYPCEFSANTMRVFRIAGLAKPRINAIIEYEEMSSRVTTANAFNSRKVYADALSNLIGLILNSDLSGWAEVGLDLGALTGLPIAIDSPYFGPSFVTNGTGNGTDGFNLSDLDHNGFGDYLVAGIGLYLGVTEATMAKFLLSEIDPLISGEGHSTLSDMLGSLTGGGGGLGGLGLGPANAEPAYIPADGYPPETILEKPSKIGVQTVFKVTAYDPDSQGEPILFSYRLDGGLWTPYLPLKEIKLNGLWEGRHVLEVKAMDMEGHREGTPVKYEFVVDTQPPQVHIIGKTLTDDSPVFFVDAKDYITPSDKIKVSYSVDGSKWTPFSYDKQIELSGLSAGKHVLAVKAVDEAGNVAEVVQNFVVEDGGFGCAMTSGSGSIANFLILLILPAIFLVAIRKKEEE